MAPAFIIDDLLAILQSWPAAGRYHIAYSGGLDSQVLLHAVHSLKSQLPAEFSAIHVNHHLSPQADAWVERCRHSCDELGIALELIEIDARPPKGESQEAWARKVRYEAMEKIIQKDDMLLTAHNADDQAETLLLQLLRGSGPAGLAAMPAICRFGAGYHARPLLQYTRRELHRFATGKGLTWVEDDSNVDIRFDRNFIRHEIMLPLRERWPSLTGTLSRAAQLQAQAAGLLEELAALDLDHCLVKDMEALDIRRLKKLSPARCGNVLRYWIKQSGFPGPDSRQLHQIFTDVLNAKPDANPCVSWPGTEVRRFHDYLIVMKPLPAPPGTHEINWNLDEPCRLPLGVLHAYRGRGEGIGAAACPDGVLQVRFRMGGEVIQREGSQHHQQLKKLFQEYAIPSWLRDYIPLLYKDGELVSVAGKWIAREFAATADEVAWQINWTIPAGISYQAESAEVNQNAKPVAIDEEAITLQLLYEKWLRKEEWLLKSEALPLLQGRDPEAEPEADNNKIEECWKEMVLAVKEGRLAPVSDQHLGESQWRAGIEDIYRWAVNAGISLPEPYKILMGFILKAVKR